MGDQVKIVAIGDSNTDKMFINTMFNALCYTDFLELILQNVPPGDTLILNRGKSGETTIDLGARFRKAVIEEHPDYAIIFGGTNDAGYIAQVIANGNIPLSTAIASEIGQLSLGGLAYLGLRDIEGVEKKLERGAEIANGHLEEMCDAALTNGITPILCTIPPYKKGNESPQIDYGKKVIRLMNDNIRAFCNLNPGRVVLADGYIALDNKTEPGYMNPEFSADLIHLNERGQAKLAAVLFKALTESDIEFSLHDGYLVSS